MIRLSATVTHLHQRHPQLVIKGILILGQSREYPAYIQSLI